MSQPPTHPVVPKVEAAMASAEIDAELICTLRTPSFPQERTNMIHRDTTSLKEWANVWSPDKKPRKNQCVLLNSRIVWWSVHRRVQDEQEGGRSGSHQLPFPKWWDNLPPHAQKIARQQDLCSWGYLEYYQHIGPVIAYFNSMSSLQTFEGEDTENPLICHIMNLLWLLSNKGTCVRFCWIPSHCGIVGNERVDQLAEDTLHHDIDLLASVNFADLKPLVDSYLQ